MTTRTRHYHLARQYLLKALNAYDLIVMACAFGLDVMLTHKDVFDINGNLPADVKNIVSIPLHTL